MNISSKTISTLKGLGYTVKAKDWEMTDTPVNSATHLHIFCMLNGYFSIFVKAPKSKEVTVDWILSKINTNKDYENITKYVRNLLDTENCSLYAASYGIGLDTISQKYLDENKDKVSSILDAKGIKYRTGLSDAGWVYRFIISKDKENMEIIKSL